MTEGAPPNRGEAIKHNIKMKEGNKMKAIIERGTDGGFSVYTEEVNGAFGYGLTEQEAKDDFMEILEEQAEYYKEKTGEFPKWYGGGKYEVEYAYDLSGFFERFPFINATAFAKEIGLSPCMMRKYKRKIVPVSSRQRETIQKRYNELIDRMRAVVF